MSRADTIRKHIAVLTDFERDYREYVHALEDEERTGRPYWHPRAQAQRRANLIKQASRVGQARKASGMGLTLNPPPFSGGPPLTDFASQIMAHENPPWSGAPNRLEAPRQVLDSVVAAIGALELQLEGADAEGEERPKRATPVSEVRRGWPTVVGRIRHVPRVIGVIADVGGAAAVFYAVGRFVLGIW